MKFFEITDRELDKALVVAKEKHGVKLDRDVIKDLALKIQAHRSRCRVQMPEARDAVLKKEYGSADYPEVRCALGALFAERKKIHTEEELARKRIIEDRQFLASIKGMYYETLAERPELLPIDPDAEPWATSC